MRGIMADIKKVFEKQGGTELLKRWWKAGVLPFAVAQALSLGFSKKSLEILRLSVNNKILQKLHKKYRKEMAAFDPTAEFGIDQARYRAICARVDEMLSAALSENGVGDFVFESETASPEPLPPVLRDPAYEIVYEKHGWRHVKDFFPEFSRLEDGGEYQLVFALTEDKANQTAFSTTVLNLLLDENPGKKRTLGCDTTDTKDGENHFWLLKKRF